MPQKKKKGRSPISTKTNKNYNKSANSPTSSPPYLTRSNSSNSIGYCPPNNNSPRQNQTSELNINTSNLASIIEHQTQATMYSVSTSNSFEALNNIRAENTRDKETDENENREANENSPNQKKNVPLKITPIIIEPYGQSVEEIKNRIKKVCNTTPQLKYVGNQSGKKISIHCFDLEDYNHLNNHLKEHAFSFHTFTLPKDKQLSAVLKGLPPDITKEEILEEIKLDIPQVMSVDLMKTPNSEFQPIFLVKFSNEIQFHDVTKIRFISHIKIYWQKYTPINKVTQCYRCQAYGHGMRNCNRPAKCFKCAGTHMSANCKKLKDTPPKCANCNEEHLANSKQCKYYLEYIEKRNPASNKRYTDKNQSQRYYKESYKHISTAYPPLPQKIYTPSSNNTNHWTQHPKTKETPVTSNFDTEEINDFIKLQQSIKELNKICNLKEMITKIQQLTEKIKNSNNEAEKLNAFLSVLLP
ncbi:hypothetical protein M8J77_022884 [Diaphorina citri]|nr:hypothetical protein M8J77_022884 [Diaphorina citri]